MLSQALLVVHAARALQPEPTGSIPGLWRLRCEPRMTATYVRELGEALAAFDKATARAEDPASMLAKAMAFVTEKGIDPAEFMAAIGGGPAAPGADPEAVDEEDIRPFDDTLRPKPGEIGPPDRETGPSPRPRPLPPRIASKYKTAEELNEADSKIPSPTAPRPNPVPGTLTAPAIVAAGAVAVAAPAPRPGAPRLGVDVDVALHDGGDYSHDGGLSEDAIEDRLEYAVNKIGMTPRMRILVAALRNTRNRIAAGESEESLELVQERQRISKELQEVEQQHIFVKNEPVCTLPKPGMR